MKKHYETPSVEKIAFRYRDQVVAASSGGSDGSSAPGFGEWTNENTQDCDLYMFEATGSWICDFM